jgi:DNA-binding CsgD family transcriptional regulator
MTPFSPDRTVLPLIGRDADLVRLTAEFLRGGSITLIGPPGVGKKRLVRECASQLDPKMVASNNAPNTLENRTVVSVQYHFTVQSGRVIVIEPLAPEAAATLFEYAAQQAGITCPPKPELVRAICAELDHLPGPLIAAARVTASLPLNALYSALRDGHPLETMLSTARRDAFVWGLSAFERLERRLSALDRDLLRYVSMFEGRFSLASAEVVASSSLEPAAVFSGLARLVDAGVLRVEGGGELAYTLGRYLRTHVRWASRTASVRADPEIRWVRYCAARIRAERAMHESDITVADFEASLQRSLVLGEMSSAARLAAGLCGVLIDRDGGSAQMLYQQLLAHHAWSDAERLDLLEASCVVARSQGASQMLKSSVFEGAVIAKRLSDGAAERRFWRFLEPMQMARAEVEIPLPQLSGNNLVLARGLMRGETNIELARRAGISINVVRHSLSALYRAYGCRSRLEFVQCLRR